MRARAWACVAHAKDEGLQAEVVVRDRDRKFRGREFDVALEEGGARAVGLPIRPPNLNAYVDERFVQAVQQECLDRLIVFGPEHFDHVLGQ
jgi:hypothetical protein